jgi:hypothetical protein
MIQIIGIMMGAYIFTKMLAIAMDKEAGIIVGIFAGITMFIAAAGLFLLITSGIHSVVPGDLSTLHQY